MKFVAVMITYMVTVNFLSVKTGNLHATLGRLGLHRLARGGGSFVLAVLLFWGECTGNRI